jgi:hypothetical protein
MAMLTKPALGAASIVISIVAYTRYLRRTAEKGGIRPHPYSWLPWGLVSAVAFCVQLTQGGGLWGSLVTGLTAVACFAIVLLTLSRHDRQFDGFDRLLLLLAFGALILYLYYFLRAKNPTLSAVLATVTDVLGYGPTIKKGWRAPDTDDAPSFFLNGLKFIPAYFALESYSVATWLYPTTLAVVNGGVWVMLLVRGWQEKAGR